MNDGGEQRRLVRETVIERALGDADALRHGFDAGGAKAVGKKQLRRRVEDQLPKLLGRFARRAPSPAHLRHFRLSPLRIPLPDEAETVCSRARTFSADKRA